MSICTDSLELNKRVYRNAPSSENAPQPSSGFSVNSDTLEITVVTEGVGIHRIMNEQTECHAGDMYVFVGGVPHEYFALHDNEELTVLSLSFSVSEILKNEAADRSSREYCYGIFRDKSPVSYALLNSEALLRVSAAFSDISAELEHKESGWQDAICAQLRLIMIYLGRYVNLADTAQTEKPKEWMTVSTAIAEINERFGESDLNLESVAASLFISQSRLSRIFHKVTGESFPDYVRGVRLRHACELLKNSELTNEEIVRRCGLKDVPSFYRLFKSCMGMTPGKYRSEHNGGTTDAEAQNVFDRISDSIKRGKNQNVLQYLDEAIAMGLSTADILKKGLIRGMDSVGERFKKNEVYVPEVLVAARAMNAALTHLKQYISEEDLPTVGKVCIGTVQGDLHDIGKNLVKIMMESKGLQVIDLGVDVAAERFIEAAMETGCTVIACSALLTTTMGVLADVVRLADEQGLRPKIKIIVGGAPISAEYAASIGADGYTADAANAADMAYKFCTESSDN